MPSALLFLQRVSHYVIKAILEYDVINIFDMKQTLLEKRDLIEPLEESESEESHESASTSGQELDNFGHNEGILWLCTEIASKFEGENIGCFASDTVSLFDGKVTVTSEFRDALDKGKNKKIPTEELFDNVKKWEKLFWEKHGDRSVLSTFLF